MSFLSLTEAPFLLSKQPKIVVPQPKSPIITFYNLRECDAVLLELRTVSIEVLFFGERMWELGTLLFAKSRVDRPILMCHGHEEAMGHV